MLALATCLIRSVFELNLSTVPGIHQSSATGHKLHGTAVQTAFQQQGLLSVARSCALCIQNVQNYEVARSCAWQRCAEAWQSLWYSSRGLSISVCFAGCQNSYFIKGTGWFGQLPQPSSGGGPFGTVPGNPRASSW